MVRTQIYLTERERNALQSISDETGHSQSALIRQAIDRLIEQFERIDRLALLQQARGLWQHRDDLPDFSALRRELDRPISGDK